MKTALRSGSRSYKPASTPAPSLFKKESSKPAFFEAPALSPFFTPAPATVQRKCDKCDEEKKQSGAMSAPAKAADEIMHKMKDKEKEDDKSLQRKESGAAP